MTIPTTIAEMRDHPERRRAIVALVNSYLLQIDDRNERCEVIRKIMDGICLDCGGHTPCYCASNFDE
jgi:hypothetical protein